MVALLRATAGAGHAPGKKAAPATAAVPVSTWRRVGIVFLRRVDRAAMAGGIDAQRNSDRTLGLKRRGRD